MSPPLQPNRSPNPYVLQGVTNRRLLVIALAIALLSPGCSSGKSVDVYPYEWDILIGATERSLSGTGMFVSAYARAPAGRPVPDNSDAPIRVTITDNQTNSVVATLRTAKEHYFQTHPGDYSLAIGSSALAVCPESADVTVPDDGWITVEIICVA